MTDRADIEYAPPERGLFHTSEPLLGAKDDRGVRPILHGGMWPSQKLWWDLPNFVRLFIGGYGAGKTIQLCKRMISLAAANGATMRKAHRKRREWWKDYKPTQEPVPVAIVSPTYPMARETVLVTIESLLYSLKQWGEYWSSKGYGDWRIDYSVKRNPPMEVSIFVKKPGCVPVKGRIVIYSGENPDKLKGPNLGGAGIDEPFIQDQEVFTQMSARCRHPRSKRIELNLTGTPEQLNWGYDLAEGDLRERYDVAFVQASTLENKALPEDYVKRLLDSLDPKAAEAYVHGMFVNLGTGLVYYAFNKKENVVELDMPRGAQMGVGMDFNVNPMSAAVFWYVNNGVHQHIHFVDEIELPNSDTPTMAQELMDRYGRAGICRPRAATDHSDMVLTHSPLEDVYPDSNVGRSTSAAAGKTDYDHLKEAGFKVHNRPQGNPPVRDRYNSVNAMLRARDGRVRMTFSSRCQKLVKYQMLYQFELRNRDNQKAMSHLLDARDYAVFRLFPANRELLHLSAIEGF